MGLSSDSSTYIHCLRKDKDRKVRARAQTEKVYSSNFDLKFVKFFESTETIC